MRRLQVFTGMEYVNRIDDVLKAEVRERILQEYIICPLIEALCHNEDVVPVDIKVSGKIHNYKLYCGSYGYTKNGELETVTETPDLCIAKDWIWLNNQKNKSNYIATVEIKTVYSGNEYWIAPGYMGDKIVFENKVEDILKFVNDEMLSKNIQGEYNYVNDEQHSKSLQKQIGIHLRGIDKVIATDGVRWIFFYKNENSECFALPSIDLGKRICKKPRKYYKHVRIDWDLENKVIKGRCLGKNLKNFELLKYVIQEFCARNVDDMGELKAIIERRMKM